ncbi:unnamed protein product [Rodentolepis nana]|uniref:Synapsin_C domain-containing protein n=1 Tax=Rodentolepis nana TaxID=102285 RepID=A0A0R3TXM6_RODNA|nr:unnamed protein product [Rodentolepis nana]
MLAFFRSSGGHGPISESDEFGKQYAALRNHGTLRKPISNPSFGSPGSTVLEKIPISPIFNQWITEISQLFGGLDMCAVKALQDANGDYYIQDVYGSDFLLLGDGQEEDRARIAELLIQKMEYVHKTLTGASRRISQSQLSSGSQSVFSPSNPPQDQVVKTAFGQARSQTTQQPPSSMQDQQMRLAQTQQSSFGMQDLPSRPQPPRQPSLSDQQRPQKPPAPNTTGSSASQNSGQQNVSGGSMDFGQSRPLLQTQQKAQSIFDSPSQASRNEFSSRDSFDRSKITPTMNASMDFSSTPSQSSRMNFGRDNEDTFGVGSTTSSTAGMLRSNTEGKTPDPWSTGPSRTVREPSLDGTGRKKEAAPQPPRQPSLTNSFENRNFDTFGGSSGSSASVTSTNIFDPSANIFQPQTQSKPSSAMSTFQSHSQGGMDAGDSMNFNSPSMDFGQSSSKPQHNDPWSVPQSQLPFGQTSQFSSASNTSMSGTSSTAPRPRPTTQQSSGNPDDGEDTMKNLRKTFAGIFGDI